jgi:hypothetical protein
MAANLGETSLDAVHQEGLDEVWFLPLLNGGSNLDSFFLI